MEPTGCSVEEVLQVLRLVYVLSKEISHSKYIYSGAEKFIYTHTYLFTYTNKK